MGNRLILAFISFISGLAVMALKYDSILASHDIVLGTHAISAGLSVQLTSGIKIAWTIALVLLMIVCVIFTPKKGK